MVCDTTYKDLEVEMSSSLNSLDVGCQKAGQYHMLFGHRYKQFCIQKNTHRSVSQSASGQGTILSLVLENGIRNQTWSGKQWLFGDQLHLGLPTAPENPEWPHTSKSSSHWEAANSENLI